MEKTLNLLVESAELNIMHYDMHFRKELMTFNEFVHSMR
ncbi:hypothetical protein SAMN05428981_11374 [Bacillus sp. OV194]|nr:hypothetical protein SAMN05428981_11374 [Bacillus sp. OV194]